MADRFETAYVFGTLGNLSGALGDGWSAEDHYAWAVGEHSRLSLPLPGDTETYILRLSLHPLVHPGRCESQRLTIAAGDVLLGHFDVPHQATVDVPLPLALTRERTQLDLRLTHPDALRPRDFKDSTDSRWLSLCFHSGGLVRASDGTGGNTPEDVMHAVVAGHALARQIAAVMAQLSPLRGRIAFHYVSPDGSLDAATRHLPADALPAAQIYWRQSGVGTPEVAAAINAAVPADCDVQRIPSPHMTALWPLQGADPRRIAEPGRYGHGRYMFSDRVGASMANMMLQDDVVLLAYESMAEKEMPDLDASLDADVAVWRQLDATNDVRVADFILANFRRQRMFLAPPLAGSAVLRHIIDQLIETPAIRAVASPADLARELDFLLSGYVGHWQELPIHPHIARHFGLQWWQPGMRYRWFGNSWTFEEYALNYIRWNAWRP
ncbi:MAG TPA: WcbI family polysaccharide biosynthesis putative acetyltransferase [Acetobacteraceae bacterium]|jgi:hypothetical protein